MLSIYQTILKIRNWQLGCEGVWSWGSTTDDKGDGA